MGSSQFMSRMFHPGAWGALEVLVLVFVALMVAFLVVLVIRSFGGGSLQQGRGDRRWRSPLEVLEDRTPEESSPTRSSTVVARSSGGVGRHDTVGATCAPQGGAGSSCPPPPAGR